jgi:hypothetical protein
MNANTATRTETTTDIGYETSKFALNVGMGTAALIGIWGVACLIGGLVANGAGGVLTGYLSAIGL